MEAQNNLVYNLLFEASKLERVKAPIVVDIADWETLIVAAQRSYLSPILSKTIDKSDAPKSVIESFANPYCHVLARNIALQHAFTEFAKKLNNATIPFVPLKGIYLSEFVYKDLGFRHLSDIDVLVKTESVEAVCNQMKNDDWEVKPNIRHSKTSDKNFKHAHPFSFVKNGVIIELHTHLYNQNECAKISKSQIWSHTKTEKFLSIEIQQFDTEFLVQYLCLHLHKHLIGSELKLVSFCDIRELLLVYDNSFDWIRLKELNNQYQCISAVNQIMYLLQKYWNLDLPKSFLDTSLNYQTSEQKFWAFLTGQATNSDVFLKNSLERKERELDKLRGTRARTNYVLGQIFPKRSFMERRYQLEPNAFLVHWYCIRIVELGGKFLRAKL